MQRKDFLKNSLGLIGAGGIIFEACKKSDMTTPSSSSSTSSTSSSGCSVSPEETEGPYPYPSGEANLPLQRADVTGGQTGLPLTLTMNIVNANSSCAVVSGARVDIWQCNALGYYSGYANQTGGASGTKSYVGETWLRGYQLSDTNGQVKFTTIYPGWYTGRATHIHVEVYVNNVLKKTTQIAFPEDISKTVYATTNYSAHGQNTITNASDGIFGDSSADLAKEMISISGNTSNGYAGSMTIGLSL